MSSYIYNIPTALFGEYLTPQEFDELVSALGNAPNQQEFYRIWEAALGETRVPIPRSGLSPDVLRTLVGDQLRALRAERYGVPSSFLELLKPGDHRIPRLRSLLLELQERFKDQTQEVPFFCRSDRDVPFYLVYPFDSPWYEESARVWGVTPRLILDILSRYGRRAGMVIAETAYTISALTPFQASPWSHSRGFHYGEAFKYFLPPRSVVRRGLRAVRRWQKATRFLRYSPVLHSDRMRLGHLSSFWIQVAVFGCLDHRPRSASRVDWGRLAVVMRRQADPVWDPATPPGVLKAFAWWKVFGRIPKDPHVFSLPESYLPELKRVWKHFAWLLGKLPFRAPHDVLAAANLAIAFGGRVKQLLDKHGMSIHDLGIDLQPPYSKDLLEFIWKYRHIDYAGAVQVANSWETIVHLGGHLGMSLRELKAVLASARYTGVRHLAFAQECARWGASQVQFDRFQSRWLLGLELLTRESIPRVDITDGEYRLYRLAKDDPRGLFLGLYTGCCQHPTGAGKSCAWHGHESPDGAFYVVEYRGCIIAQAWVWRQYDDPVYRHILVLDNVEVLGSDRERRDVVWSLFIRAAHELLGRLGIAQVNIGAVNTDIDLDGFRLAKEIYYAPPFTGIYSDATRQFVVAGDVVAYLKEVI